MPEAAATKTILPSGFEWPRPGKSGLIFQLMPVVKKLAAPKARTPKALGAVARQQLLLVNGLLDEVARNYVARLHREIAELIRALERKQAEPACSRRDLKAMRAMLKQIAQLQINPEKGRRKDLKKIDSLIGDLQSTVDRW
jgi:hypothetical protein